MKQIVSTTRRKVKKPPVLAPDPRDLLAWYDHNRRILPWRALPGVAPDPYRVWLSEIMLQQTTVAAVGPYFQKFIRRWPTLPHLAKARLEDVLRLWAGLGYYRRARLLHECARQIMANYGEQFPESVTALQELPGFGPYTAAAVAAIAFDQRANVVDGNVERVMIRLYALRAPLPQIKTKVRALAAKLLPDHRYGDYAQALMDLGATICTPRNPKCALCPWSGSCRAQMLGIADRLPRKTKAAEKPVRRALAFAAFNKKGELFIRARPEKGLLGGMMEIPSSAWQTAAMPTLAAAWKEAPFAAKWRIIPGTVRHVFSHFTLEIIVAVGRVQGSAKGGTWVAPDDLAGEALPSVMRKIAQHALKAL